MTVSIQVLRDSYVKPKPPAPPVEEVELAGVDVLFKRMNLRFAYFFPETLSAAALKASLAEVSPCAVGAVCFGGAGAGVGGSVGPLVPRGVLIKGRSGLQLWAWAEWVGRRTSSPCVETPVETPPPPQVGPYRHTGSLPPFFPAAPHFSPRARVRLRFVRSGNGPL